MVNSPKPASMARRSPSHFTTGPTARPWASAAQMPTKLMDRPMSRGVQSNLAIVT